MEWLEDLNRALDYVEAHLTDEVDLDALSRIARCSTYHFQRIFAYLAGVTLGEYIRRRRMSLAAEALGRGEKVVDVALAYGYESPTAFNRAFRAVHGIAPSQARIEGATVKAYPALRFHMTVKGTMGMEYRIEKKDAIRLIGVSVPLSKELEKNFETVPGLWARAATQGTLGRLCALMDSPPMGVLGVSVEVSPEEWRYYIAVPSAQEVPEGLEEALIPPMTFAVFPGEGKNTALQELERRIVTEWLPTSGYAYADGPDVEVYFNPDPENARFEVWIPVEKRNAR